MLSASVLSLIIGGASLAQTGNYEIKQSIVATGGGSISGGAFTLESTTGQTAASNFFAAQPYSLYAGFWTPNSNSSPTAASVAVTGRITTADNRPIINVRITLTNSSGETRFAQTGFSGFYRFENVPAGQTYVLTVYSKRFVFAAPSRILNVTEEVNDINFVAERQ